MKTKFTLFMMALGFFSLKSWGQFNFDPAQPYFICSATGTQNTAEGFVSGNNHYLFWIDKRNGNAGSGVYAQRVD